MLQRPTREQTLVMNRLLPQGFCIYEHYGRPRDFTLLDEEEHCMRDAVQRRRREFSTGRHCARTAVALLGLPPCAITRRANGSPCWPRGVAAPTTHCRGPTAAAVARQDTVLAFGIDAEPNTPLPPSVTSAITTPAERKALSRNAQVRPGIHWDHVLQSAKESVFKAWWPFTQKALDFTDAHLAFDLISGGFTAHLHPRLADDIPMPVISGRWQVHQELIQTVAFVPHGPS